MITCHKLIGGALAITALLVVAGCGYRLVGRGEGPVAGRPVAVAVFANKTHRPVLEGVLTRALRAELATATAAGVVAAEAAELLVSGTVERLTMEPVSFTGGDRVREYRLTITASAVLSDKRSGKVLWQGRETAGVDYPANADLALQQNGEEAAVSEACRQLAARLRLALATGF